MSELTLLSVLALKLLTRLDTSAPDSVVRAGELRERAWTARTASVLVFPTSLAYAHTFAAPLSGDKYTVRMFLKYGDH